MSISVVRIGSRAIHTRDKRDRVYRDWPDAPVLRRIPRYSYYSKKRGDMPIKPYWSQVEPAKDVELWRFMDLRKFRDLMASEELYFRRADLYPDQSEGLPPEAYALRVLG